MRLFTRLGPINSSVQGYLSAYYQWKKTHRQPPREPLYFDFTEIGSLAEAAETFYQVGVSVEEAKQILAQQVSNLEELARFIGAHVASVVLDDRRILTNRSFIEGLDVARLTFDPEDMRRRWCEADDSEEPYEWSFDPFVMDRFRTPETPETEAAEAAMVAEGAA